MEEAPDGELLAAALCYVEVLLNHPLVAVLTQLPAP